MNCLGIPVHYSPMMTAICESRGVWPFKEIWCGPDFPKFPPRIQQAFLLHEAGHCKLFHVEWPILNLWRLVYHPLWATYIRFQELQADYFVKECGYGRDLAHGFGMIAPPSEELSKLELACYPDRDERIARLLEA